MACTVQYHNARTIKANRQQRIEEQAIRVTAQVMHSADIIERSAGLTHTDSLRIAEHLIFRD